MVDDASTQSLELVAYDLDCLEKSWVWLNDPEIRQLTLTPSFTKQQQLHFFEDLATRSGYCIWGVAIPVDGVVGAAGLKNHRGAIAEYWGYIGERRWWGRGLGRLLLAAVESEAIRLGFSTLDLRVSESNTRARALYMRAGYVEAPGDAKGGVLRMAKVL